MRGVTVIVPSLPQRYPMLKEALASIRRQKCDVPVEIVVALEKGAEPPPSDGFASLEAANQSAKVNAGVAMARHDIIAILHDDDLWRPEFLRSSLKELETADFCSSTALQTDEVDDIIAIADCPVPSGWVFTKALFDKVGPWSEEARFHPDSEWLGRLGETPGVRRVHLMECFCPAPRNRIGGEWRYNPLTSRPGFQAFLAQARPQPRLVRHASPSPLVIHRQHGDGIMQRINEPDRWMVSQWEYQRLNERFNRIPW